MIKQDIEYDLAEKNCKRCINYEICQGTGCAIRIQIQELLNFYKLKKEGK